MELGLSMFEHPDSKDPSRIAFKIGQTLPEFQETFNAIEKVNGLY